MNKTIISWTHYIYATITSSVLAYVTVMDSTTSEEEEDSAINMLPSISNSQSPEVEELVEVEPELVEPELVEPELVEPELVEAEPIEPELVEAEPINREKTQQSQYGSSGGKLKKNKTKTNNKNKKVNKTRGRK